MYDSIFFQPQRFNTNTEKITNLEQQFRIFKEVQLINYQRVNVNRNEYQDFKIDFQANLLLLFPI
ncbi:hypothetical protein CD33_18710 [Ureibacillus sinduriensis BLB-1 = JCM 15800]|uniref:Uncharacterized protein n=1 Tax=Ureibacillus sinduriensis BLB-1 = JCM 15800 TaxID=1384057 RepID=A0A0A3HS43_9BACL|nr:hypothetical protein CD33_18710 [Ureibacillus sinduriensis BLB-1 = JCM 15800]